MSPIQLPLPPGQVLVFDFIKNEVRAGTLGVVAR